MAFARGGVATVSLAPARESLGQQLGVSGAPERLYRLEVFSASGGKVSLLVGRDELRRFAATLASYTAGTPPTGVPETGR